MRYLKIVCRGFVPFSKFAAFPELQNFGETYFLTTFVAFFDTFEILNFRFGTSISVFCDFEESKCGIRAGALRPLSDSF